MKKFIDGRKSLFEDLEKFRHQTDQKLAWFHVASLGEYEQAKPVISQLNRVRPELGIVVSFFSPSGYEHVIRKPQEGVAYFTYLPLDTVRHASRFLNILKPSIAFFVKYDLWANHILEAKKRNIPLFLFSASMRKEQIYFLPFGGFFRKILRSFDHIFTQNQQSLDLLRQIGIQSCSLTGDTRFDRVSQIRETPKSFPLVEEFIKDRPVLVIGSAWEEDVSILIPFINKPNEYCYIIAPHDINTSIICNWQERITKKSIRYSEIHENSTADVLLIDNIGMLSSLYQYAHIAYVGGAFGKGLHNILEPLAFGIPVIFGKLRKARKFPEAKISEAYGAAYSVPDFEDFDLIMSELAKPEVYQQTCEAANKLVSINLGSAEKIIKSIMKQSGNL